MGIISTDVRKYKGGRRKGEKIKQWIDLPNGKRTVVKMKKYKHTPKGCSVVRQLCLKCKKHIHKNDLNYDKKICKSCDVNTSMAVLGN